MNVPVPAAATGYVTGVTAEHARCHCISLHSVAPIFAHALTASLYLRFVHGWTPAREHANALVLAGSLALAVPCAVVVASGFDASYFIISLPPPMATHS